MAILEPTTEKFDDRTRSLVKDCLQIVPSVNQFCGSETQPVRLNELIIIEVNSDN